MLGCTLAWPRTLPEKLRRASGSGFKVRGARVGAGEGGRRDLKGRVQLSCALCPLAPPNVIGPQGPRFVVGLAPGQLVLECSVKADPAPEIEWHRDGILLQVGARLGAQGTILCPPQAPDPDQPGSQVPRVCSVPALCIFALLFSLLLLLLPPYCGWEH